MGRKKYKSNFQSFQSAKGGKMVALFNDLLESKAGIELMKDAKALQLYILFLKEYKAEYHEGILLNSNKDHILLPITTYKQYMTPRTFDKTVDTLIELGFIKLIKSGYQTREPNIYGFNDMWQYYRTAKFYIKDEWRRHKKEL